MELVKVAYVFYYQFQLSRYIIDLNSWLKGSFFEGEMSKVQRRSEGTPHSATFERTLIYWLGLCQVGICGVPSERQVIFRAIFPGRCPGLVCSAPLGRFKTRSCRS